MRQPVDIKSRLRGVKPRPAKVELCTDPEFRDRIEKIIEDLQATPVASNEGSLADADPREKLLADLAAANQEAEDAGAWMRFTLHAPSHEARVGHMAALASMTDDVTQQRETLVASEIQLLMSAVKEIDGEPADLDEDDARVILCEWDEALAKELIEAINEFSPESASLPFSQRVSATLATQKH